MDKKNFIWNTIGSTFNSLTSLFFMIIVTRLNGVNEAGIFTFSFSFALLMQVIGNYFGRSYQVTNIDDDITDSDFVYSRFLTCFLMILFTFVFILFKNYSFNKIIVIVLLVSFRLIESFGEVLYGIIQKGNKLYCVGISMFLKGLFSIFLFFCFDYFLKNLYLAIISISVINMLFIVFYDYRNTKKENFKLRKFNSFSLKRIMFDGFFVFLFTFLTQYVLNASKYSIDAYLSDNYQTIFGIILMPATVMALWAQFLVQPFLTKFSYFLKTKKYNDFSKLVFKLSIFVFLFGIFSTVFCYYFGITILQLIYKLNLNEYSFSLALIIFGSTFFGLSYVYSNVLITIRKNFIQTIIYGVTALISFFISNLFVINYGVFGASLAYFISMFILFILYLCTYLYHFNILNKKYDYNIHSFVVLAYKESPFLEDCIKSVINQSVKSNVIIATTTPNKYIDDIAKKYDIDVVVGKHTSIGGDFDFALSSSKMNLVTIAHQDDIYDYDYSKEIIDNYYRYKNTLILFSDYYEIRGSNKVYNNSNLKIKRILLSSLFVKKFSGLKFLKRNSLRFGCSICCPAVTFVKSNIPESVFKCDMKSNVDWFAWEKLSRKRGKFVYVNKRLMGHRIDESTTTSGVISSGIRTNEDFEMFKKFWPSFIAKFINKFYKRSESSNSSK